MVIHFLLLASPLLVAGFQAPLSRHGVSAPARTRMVRATVQADSDEAAADATAAAPATPAAAAPAKIPEALQKEYRRAEFWDEERGTLFDIINVVGRWESASEWQTRTLFTVIEDTRTESEYQSATKQRYEKAQKMGCVERIALRQNVRNLPFTNDKLAASYGLTVDDFNAVPVNRDAVNIVYDALAESKSGLIPPDVVDKRRAAWLTEEGGFDEGRFLIGLNKSRALVIFSWFFFGKGQVIGALVALKILADSIDFWNKYNVPPGFDYLVFVAAAGFAVKATNDALATPKIEEY